MIKANLRRQSLTSIDFSINGPGSNFSFATPLWISEMYLDHVNARSSATVQKKSTYNASQIDPTDLLPHSNSPNSGNNCDKNRHASMVGIAV